MEQEACAAGEAGGAAGVVATFDFVTVQLYEGYSHAHVSGSLLVLLVLMSTVACLQN